MHSVQFIDKNLFSRIIKLGLSTNRNFMEEIYESERKQKDNTKKTTGIFTNCIICVGIFNIIFSGILLNDEYAERTHSN